MPVLAIIYINVFAAIVLVNAIFWMQIKQKRMMILYQLTSGFYLVYLMISFWDTEMLEELSLYNIPAVFAVFAADLYISLWVKKKVDILRLLPELDEEVADIARQFSVIEIAKGFSLLLNAPAYVIGGLVALSLMKRAII